MPVPIDALTADERADFNRLQEEIGGTPGVQVGLFRVYIDGKPKAAVCSVRFDPGSGRFRVAPIAVLLTEKDTIEFPPERPGA